MAASRALAPAAARPISSSLASSLHPRTPRRLGAAAVPLGRKAQGVFCPVYCRYISPAAPWRSCARLVQSCMAHADAAEPQTEPSGPCSCLPLTDSLPRICTISARQSLGRRQALHCRAVRGRSYVPFLSDFLPMPAQPLGGAQYPVPLTRGTDVNGSVPMHPSPHIIYTGCVLRYVW